MKNKIGIIVALALLFALMITGVACREATKPADTSSKKDETTLNDDSGDTTAGDDTEKTDDTTSEVIKIPEFVNPLTGLSAESDVSKKRPVSIMVNNVRESLPQEGIGQADILYECLAEGGITRLMMIVTEYEKLTKVGSVRSARDYYIDYAEGYDCIFVHAGGSENSNGVYTFAGRSVNRIDGVKGPAALYYTTDTFVRDPDRLKQFATEHTLVVKSGKGLVNAIEYYKYRTEKNAGYEAPMNFVEFGKTAELDNKATHVKAVMSNYQVVDFVYNEKTGEYLRYQHNGNKHIDNTTGKQLSFENVLLVFANSAPIPNDPKNRITVTTTGSGSGWYITNGTYQKITWKKDSTAAVVRYYYEDGTEVSLNRGKTMINVVPTGNASSVKFDNEWKDK